MYQDRVTVYSATRDTVDAWRLSCSCGGERFRAFVMRKGDLGTLHLECTACGASFCQGGKGCHS